MKNRMPQKRTVACQRLLVFVCILIFVLAIGVPVFASTSDSDQSTTNYYLGSVVNTGKDNGYSEDNNIELKDPQYGWTLGRFFISGFTRVQEDTGSNPVFLKTLGDTVALMW